MKIKNIICNSFLFLFLGSCQGLKKQKDREPKSITLGRQSEYCGWMKMPESNYNTLDQVDLKYSFQVDCNQNSIQDTTDAQAFILIPATEISKEQKNWIKKRIVKSIRKTKKLQASPLVCFQAQTEVDPCGVHSAVIGHNIEFKTQK